MKKVSMVLAIALFSLSAMAVSPSVQENYDLLTPSNQAKADQGKIASVIVVNKKAPAVVRSSNGESIGSVGQALVNELSCYATLEVERNNYATTGGGCGDTPIEYLDSANVAVTMDFETFGYDLTDIEVILYARNKYNGEIHEVDSVYYTYESDIWGNGANTVVFVVDGSYANDYTLSADVYLDDELGTACVMETNNDTIYE